jgi:hypothetical protein
MLLLAGGVERCGKEGVAIAVHYGVWTIAGGGQLCVSLTEDAGT